MKNRNGIGNDREPILCNLHENWDVLTLKEKQVVSANYSHKKRTIEVEEKIKNAVIELKINNRKVTYDAVSLIIGFERMTVSKYKALL